MKDGNELAQRLKRLCAQVRRIGAAVEDVPEHDPTTELIMASLAQRTTESRARYALSRLQSCFADYNELRVSRPEDIADILGKTFPEAREVGRQITMLLRAVYDKRDHLDLSDLIGMGKREARQYLSELNGSSDYVTARVMLCSLKGHAFPVCDSMLAMLRTEGIVADAATLAEVQGFMERHIPARQGRKLFAQLTWYAENYSSQKLAETDAAPPTKPKTATKKKTAKKTKKTTKKKKS